MDDIWREGNIAGETKRGNAEDMIGKKKSGWQDWREEEEIGEQGMLQDIYLYICI